MSLAVRTTLVDQRQPVRNSQRGDSSVTTAGKRVAESEVTAEQTAEPETVEGPVQYSETSTFVGNQHAFSVLWCVY